MSDGFKHITVTPADQDDEVVFAGASDTLVEAGDSAAMPNSQPGVECVPQPGFEPESQTQLQVQPAPELAPESDIALAAPASVSKRSKQASRSYETALEDLDAPKMPPAQRAVIIAAIVCIIGALVYYFVAMR